MESGSPASSPSGSDRQDGYASNYDEFSMQQSIIFSDCLKDLKTLRLQLYSAAEYFEQAYTKDNQKQLVVDTLKDYAVKALVNTVDHLGSVSFKVTNLLDEKLFEVSDTELRVSCIEQRIRTCQDCTDIEGLSQQSSIMTAPKYYRRYILQSGGSMPDAGKDAVPNYREINKARIKPEIQQHQLQPLEAKRPKPKEKQSSFSKLRSMSRLPSQRARSVSPSKAHPGSPKPSKLDRRSESPIPNHDPFGRSGSLARKPSLLKSSSVSRSQQDKHPSDGHKLATLMLHAEREEKEAAEHTPKKGKKFLKSFLSRRKSKKDETHTLSSFLDEY